MSRRKISIAIASIFIPVFAWFFWHASTSTLTTRLSSDQKASEQVKQSLTSLPALPIKEEDKQYTIEDTRKDGIQITYANQTDTALAATPDEEKPSPAHNDSRSDLGRLTLHFPKQYATDPIEVQIAEGKSILIQDKNAKGNYTAESLSLGNTEVNPDPNNKPNFFRSLFNKNTSTDPQSYLSYTDPSKRITTYYAYGHDQATGEKQLKNWQVYTHPSIVKGEQVAYSFTNAKLKKNENGTISVYYYGDQELQNDKASSEVDPSLMARAQRTLAKDMGDSIDNGIATPNFTIPKPYYVNSSGDRIDLDWRLSMDGKDISIDFSPDVNEYPLALDPTLSFTAPAMSNTGDVITGEGGSSFGKIMTIGDFNADGRTDLAVGAPSYSSATGRVYIFYGDGGIPTAVIGADVVITGSAGSDYFGQTVVSGDFNSDGRIDLAVGAPFYGGPDAGAVHIFYNDGSYSLISTAADVLITGNAAGDKFGRSLTVGDLNADGQTDLVVGAYDYSSSTGRVYIFYNDGSIPTTAGTADVTITGNATSDQFGYAMTTSDFNADGRTDLATGAPGYSSSTGRTYIFYNDGSIPTTAATADVTITGTATTNAIGGALATGDMNEDGRMDLIVGGIGGSVYIFYNDGSIPTTAATADVIIVGSYFQSFGSSLATGDLNADGRVDLIVDAYQYSGQIGQVYVFYNDGSIPTAQASADVIITGEATSNYFGNSLAVGDLNADGRTDLVVGANGYSGSAGRTYIFYSQNGQVNTNQNITGNASGDQFGQAMTTGDFNADGRIDLAVGAPGYSTNTGRVYIFYGDGQIPSTAATADVTITGEATNNYFGASLASGDLNADGKTDLAVGAYGYSTSTGRVYIFYNDGSIPTTAATADVIITGEATNNVFGYFQSLTAGDFNTDGKIDLAVGSVGYSADTGRMYIFYNDGSIPTTAATADVTITGGATGDDFGYSLISGDFNADGRIDLATNALNAYASNGGIYIFYNDGSIPTTAATADVIISGASANSLGDTLFAGDVNTDGRIDIMSNAQSSTGIVRIFYNDGSYPATSATADVNISGQVGSYLGASFAVGDYNNDGKTDLAVGGKGYSTNTGRTYIFYNDGSLPTTAATADVTLTGETTNNYYGSAMTVGDFNADGRADLVVGAYGNATNTGKVYFYETRENFAWKLQQLSPDTGGLRTGLSGTGQEMKITGNAPSDQFGYAMTTGDFNSDGKTDLAVGAPGYNSNQGRVYLFYNDGTLSPGASGADVIITGEATGNYFGRYLAAGDLNADGKTDLAISAYNYSSGVGRAYIFYNDDSIPTTAVTADVIITGASELFGNALVAGDFNADGRPDLAVGGYYYSTQTGRVYIFYNDGSIPTTSATADVIITGETTNNYFGWTLATGDLNADGKIDLVVNAQGYSSSIGRAYIFYADGTNNFGTATCTGSSPTLCSAANADVKVDGVAGRGIISFATGDFNTDGKTDLAVGGPTGNGATYILYNDGTGTYPATLASANVIIAGEGSSGLGVSLVAGDFNSDGRTDLAIGAYQYSTNTGRAYIFYNDGSIPTTAATADVILTGETTNNYFGFSLAAGDLNADGKTDLVVGAYGYSGSRGRAYIYTLNDPVITGEATSNSFGISLVSGDFNSDGKVDLAVGASGYSTNTGRVYLFYQDGTIPSTAATTDVIITGEATNNYFGFALTAGDFNADGKTDLAVGAYGYSSSTGRAYIFYNDGSIPTTAATADVTIAGEGGSFGFALAAGDLNADGRTDLVVGEYTRARIFYNDGSIPTTAATADVTITGNDLFGSALATGDFNADGRVDLAVGDWFYSGSSNYTGRAYIFYNDGSIPTTAATADVMIIGEEGLSSRFGFSLAAGDLNADGKTDIVIGAYRGSRAYIFYNDGSYPATATSADVTIAGAGGDYFGVSLLTSDLNADGRSDLVIGAAEGCSSVKGCIYVFYNDGTIPTTASTADVQMIGESSVSYFGWALASGDFNTDGKNDLVVGGYQYSTSTGRVYLFTSEAAVTSSPSATGRVRGVGKLRGTATLR